MDNDFRMNLMSNNSEIAPLISENCFLTKLTPFSRRIELLVDPAVETEGFAADFASEREVFETFFERNELCKLGITSATRIHQARPPLQAPKDPDNCA